MDQLKIKNSHIGEGQKTFIIAEVAQAHDGSLGMAHAFIDAIAKTGADAVKFQTHIASAESTLSEPWRVKFSKQDKTRFEYWQRMEFSEEQWAGLYKHAAELGLAFISSPFSTQAVDLLEKTGLDGYKVASGEVGNTILLESIAKCYKPVLISSGMSSQNEVDCAYKFFNKCNVPIGLFQCSSYYPCPPEKVGLNVISFFRDTYKCPVGLSDHSGKIYSSLAAVSIGAEMLEVHVTFSREMFGPDVSSSLTLKELASLVEGVRFIEAMRRNPVNKDSVANDLEPMRDLFTKSVVSLCSLEKGTILEPSHLTVKKPGTGIPADKLLEIVGCRLKNNVRENQILTHEDIMWDIK